MSITQYQLSLFTELKIIFKKDIDECKTPYICQHKCVNTFGSFQCICHEGFTLASDKRSCLGNNFQFVICVVQTRTINEIFADIDECQARSNMCSNGVCVNTPGSFECTCGAGFQVDRSRGRVCMGKLILNIIAKLIKQNLY